MDVDVRGIGEDEVDALATLLVTAFGDTATEELLEDNRTWAEPGRLLAAVEAGRFVGAAGAYSLHVTLPGGPTVPVAGVTWVGVLPTHRRRGVLNAMMRHQFDDLAARGETIALLTASEASIYGRFGYGLATRLSKVTIDTRGGLPLLAEPAAGGSLRLIDAEEARTTFPGLQDAARRSRHGELSRPATWWEVWFRDRERWRDGASPRFYVVHEHAGVADGALAYRVKEHWGDDDAVPRNEVRVVEVFAADPEVEAALLTFAADIDLTTTITTWSRPVDDPLPYRLVDSRRYRVSLVHDHLYCRVLDVPAALAARRYEAPGELVLGVEDAFLPAAGGRFRLVAGADGTATCERIGPVDDGDADLWLDSPGLGSMLLGDLRPSQLVHAGRARPSSTDALTLADRVLPTARAPFTAMEF